MQSAHWIGGMAIGFAVACSGGTDTPATPESTASPAAVPEEKEAKADEPERQNDAAKYLKVVEEDAVDPEQRGRIAANGLSEEQFGLGPLVRNVLEALSGEAVDPSQSAAIVASLLDEDADAKDAFRAACGVEWAVIGPELRKLPPPKRTDRIVEQCKVDEQRLGDAKMRAKLNFSSVILSITVEKLLEKRGGISKAERGLAAHLATLKPTAPAP